MRRAPCPTPPPQRKSRPPRQIVATYDYTDEQGTLWFQAVRYRQPDASKTFSPRWPDGNGGWIWNLKGVRRVPEILTAIKAGRTIMIPEGEKDVDRLIALGHAAACNPMGAKKWPRDFARYFVGAGTVVVRADNDLDGRDHAAQVIATLLPVVPTVKRHDFTNLPEHGDVSDWLDAGHPANTLDTLLAQAPLVTAEDLAASEAGAGEISPTSLLPQLSPSAKAWSALEMANASPRFLRRAEPSRRMVGSPRDRP